MKETQLRSCTRRELLALAAKGKVRGRHRMSKGQLIEAIRSRGPAPASHRRRSTVSSSHEVEPELQELTELPSSYGQTRLTLMGIDPFWIYAYWEVTPHDHEATMARLGPERASADWALRLYDVTYIDFDGANAHSYFDQPVDLAANNWYVNLWSSEKTYCADIGARAPSGRFAAACRSNFVHTPRADESPHYRPEWLRVEGAFDEIERVTLPSPSESRATASGSPAPARTEPLGMLEQERAPHAPVAETDIRKYYGELTSLARAAGPGERATAGKQTDPPRGGPPGGSAETRLGAAWHEVRGSSWRTLGSPDSGSWAPSGRAAADLKSNAETNVSSHVQPNQFSGRSVIPARK